MARLVRKHKKVTDNLFGRTKDLPRNVQCPLCGKKHTLDQHRFHGKGSYAKTRGL